MVSFDVVVPTVGRRSLERLLEALGADPAGGRAPSGIVLVDDRPCPIGPLVTGPLPAGVEVVSSGGRGPAGARNLGWRSGSAEWVAFLDDDVIPQPGWFEALVADLADLPHDVAGSQARLVVPMPDDRRPTDWERNVAGLECARWATADMAYRRVALAAVGGFDERFRRAYREDADLGARVMAAGWTIVAGNRYSTHPVGPADPWVSVRLQAGNADDALLRALHGPRWRELTAVPAGRRRRHLAVTASGAAATVALAARRPVLAAVTGAAWALGTAELAWARIAPGPRSRDEVETMVATSVAIPPAATWHWLRGWLTLPARLRLRHRPHTDATTPPTTEITPTMPAQAAEPVPPAAVLFDRDGTLVVDVPYNGDPERVEAMPGAREALDRLRRAGVATGVVSNQSGIARRLVSADQVEAVNRRVEELLGPLGTWAVCPHGPDDRCGCRKPGPGLVLEAAGALGVEPRHVAVIGDIGADVEAARAAGARGVLVPNAATRPEEVAAADEVASDLPAAVALLLGGNR